jgi:putative ABC transport system permease protein
MRVAPGFDPANVVVMNLSLAGEKYDQTQPKVEFFHQLLGKIESLPGVTHAGAINLIPLSRSNADAAFTVEGRPPLAKGQQLFADWRATSPGYFAAMNVPLRRGRLLDARDDREDAPRALVVSERFAARFFPGEDPLGKRLDFGEAREKGWWEIVGVVGDVKRDGLDEEIEPAAYAAYAKAPWRNMTVVVKTANDPAQIVAAVQAELRTIDRAQPIFNVQTMDRVVHESLAPQRVTTALMGIFALVALALATIGIYAVMSYAVAQRTHEIGVRMALGAQRGDILRMIVRQGMALTLVGLAAGLAASYFLTQGMSKILYGVKATDPLTFAVIPALLASVALAANYLPARRATRVDPMTALRHE